MRAAPILTTAAGEEPLVDGRTISMWAVIAAVVLGALVLTRLSAFVVRWTVRRVAARSLVSPAGWWRTRVRVGEESVVGEQRRRQRIDAASRMVNHLVSIVVWVAALITTFHLLEIDAAFFLSSAGFIGAALAIGGQHKVNDYLTGLSVHFEDRYGVGDEIEVAVSNGETLHAVVDHIGLFSTRLRDDRSTLHLPNSALSQVRNLSQEAASATFRLQVPGHRAEEVADTLRGLAGTADLTGVVFVGDIDSHQPSTGEVEVGVRTLRPLDARAQAQLVQRVEQALQSG